MGSVGGACQTGDGPVEGAKWSEEQKGGAKVTDSQLEAIRQKVREYIESMIPAIRELIGDADEG